MIESLEVILGYIRDHGLTPLVNKCDDDEYEELVEVWQGKRKLSIYVGERILILRVWGPHIHNEMQEFMITDPHDILWHLAWLADGGD